MDLSIRSADLAGIARWRDMYRLEMACQIVHDSIHSRPGWTREHLLLADGVPVGYGSVAVGGPWTGKPTLYEFYVVPTHRLHVFELFERLLRASEAVGIVMQSNAMFATVMIHTFSDQVTSEWILFHDRVHTSLHVPGAAFRHPVENELPDVAADQLQWHGVIEVGDVVAASGGILFHYNRPYGDIYMDVAEPFRRRGLGSFLVQELKRVCYEGGSLPAARCNPANVASRRTLQKAGFVPCGQILNGAVRTQEP